MLQHPLLSHALLVVPSSSMFASFRSRTRTFPPDSVRSIWNSETRFTSRGRTTVASYSCNLNWSAAFSCRNRTISPCNTSQCTLRVALDLPIQRRYAFPLVSYYHSFRDLAWRSSQKVQVQFKPFAYLYVKVWNCLLFSKMFYFRLDIAIPTCACLAISIDGDDQSSQNERKDKHAISGCSRLRLYGIPSLHAVA